MTTIKVAPKDIPDHCDVIFAPGASPRGDIDCGWIEIVANAKGRAAVERIFPDGHFAWRDVHPSYYQGETWEDTRSNVVTFPSGKPAPTDKWQGWLSVAPHIPGISEQLPRHMLCKRLIKQKPPEECTDSGLCFLMAVSAVEQSYSPTWNDDEVRAGWISISPGAGNILDEPKMSFIHGLKNKTPPEMTVNYGEPPINPLLNPDYKPRPNGLAWLDELKAKKPEPLPYTQMGDQSVTAVPALGVADFFPRTGIDFPDDLQDQAKEAMREIVAANPGASQEDVRRMVKDDPKLARLFTRAGIDLVVNDVLAKRPTPEPPAPKFPSGLPMFELSPSVCCTMSAEDQTATLKGMHECGLLHLPYDQIVVRVWVPDIASEVATNPDAMPRAFLTFVVVGDVSWSNPGDGNEWGLCFNVGEVLWDHRVQNVDDIADPNEQKAISKLCGCALSTLLIALATRHTIQHVERNTRINNKHKEIKPQFRGPAEAIYISTTRLERPAIEDMEQEPGHHASPKPHQRRGHIHTVLFGIGRRESRKQWFPPMWVNGNDPREVPPAPTRPRNYRVTA